MVLSNLIGLHEFKVNNNEVQLESNGIPIAVLEFIRVGDGRDGLLYLRFKIIENGKKKPVGIVIRSIRMINMGISIRGDEVEEGITFDLNIEYKIFGKQFVMNGTYNGKMVAISNRQLLPLISSFFMMI